MLKGGCRKGLKTLMIAGVFVLTAIGGYGGVFHVDPPVSARRRLAPQQAGDIPRLLRAAPKPLLVHGRSDADRSGLMAALFLFDVDHADAATTDRRLSLVFGHFPYLFGKTVAMDESFRDVVRRSPDVAR